MTNIQSGYLKTKNGVQLMTTVPYPIGAIYLSVDSTNPSKLFGGTWQQIAKGRTLVGVDTSQTEFNTVKKTGGSKYLQKHSHTGKTETGYTNFLRQVGAVGTEAVANHAPGYSSGGYKDVTNTNNFCGGNHWHNFTTNETGDGTSGNLQPYYTCYIWLRTA